MTSGIDHMIDRRRLKRSLTIWRIFGVIAVVGIAAVTLARHEILPTTPHVAVLDVTDIIVDDPDRSDALADVRDNDQALALIVRINSPGGTFVGGENLYRDLRSVSAVKPVVAVIGNMGTSAAYMAALGTDRIFVREGTITGSIGVILQSANIQGLLGKIGIEPETVKSGALKAQPNPAEEFTPAARAMIQGVIADMYDIFLGIVVARRQIDKDAMRVHADGRVFTGRQALEAGLVDAIGGIREARSWLSTRSEIDVDAPTVDVTPHEEDRLLELFTESLGKTLFSERLNLDGFLALWHPQLSL